jgi:lipopolysaccharide biosynthesis glycosyltransferase
MTTPITLCCDAAYARPLCVTVASIASSNPRPLDIYVAQSGVSPEDRSSVEQSALHHRVTWLEVDESTMAGALLPPHLPPAALFRLFLPELLPTGISRYLYLDTDVLVLRDLTDLLDSGLDGRAIAAVRDPWIGNFGAPNGPPYTQLGVGPNTPYFNSGVMLIDRDKWASDDVTAQSLELLRQHRLPYADQCALNTVLCNSWTAIHPRWNTQPSHATAKCHFDSAQEAGSISEAVSDPGILHFVGPKPWNAGQPAVPHADRWFEVLDSTPFASWRPPPMVTERSTPISRAFRNLRRASTRAAGRGRRALGNLGSGGQRLDPQQLALIVERTGGRIQSGPFRSMTLDCSENNVTLAPQLLGTFESELHDVLEESISHNPASITVIGRSGYYAAGMALRNPDATVSFITQDDEAKRSLGHLAELNGITQRIRVGADQPVAESSSSTRSSLWLVDMACPESELLSAAETADHCHSLLVVELCESVRPGSAGLLHNQFVATHDVALVRQSSRDPQAIRLIARWKESDRLAAMNEGSSRTKQWLVMRPREL